MILTYLKRIKFLPVAIIFLAGILFACVPFSASAESTIPGLSLSVTPTLFEMSAVPSQVWNSAVKVINNNKYEITVYIDVVNFAPQGEEGEGKFLPVFEKSTEGTTLAEWITYPHEAITIGAEQSYSVPLTVALPSNASPGGHFAAVLVGTKPPKDDGTMKVSTSQVVTSLFFVRVAGDVIENGIVRDFTVLNSFVSTPQANFEVRFENKGNVHLQPQGEITITNMWGKERGVIPINHETHFGNVLPKSIRKFEFSWRGEQSFSDIGRYKAIITLAYGIDARKFVTSTLYFYVIPIKAGLIVLSSLIIFILFLRWAIKAYIKRMLALAGIEPIRTSKASFVREGDVRIERRASIKSPVHSGIDDLKKRFSGVQKSREKITVLFQFISAYRLFFASLLLVGIAIGAGILFVLAAQQEHRDYEIIIDNSGTNTTLSSEDILRAKGQENAPVPQVKPETTAPAQTYKVILVNSSDTPGQAGSLQTQLEAAGYTIDSLKSDFEKSKEKTVIVYDSALQEQALQLSKILNGALLSANPNPDPQSQIITVYIGNDFGI